MRRVLVRTALLHAVVLCLLPLTAHAQECAVAEVGPFSLAANQKVAVCGTNLYGTGDIKVGIATYDALNAREPLDIRFVTVRPREGFCLSPRLSGDRPRPAKGLIVQAGAPIQATQDTAFPIVLSVQRLSGSTVDAADYVVWRKAFSDPEPV